MVVDLAVDRIVAGGSGLAQLDGLKVFVPFAAPQERIKARLVTRKKDYAVAEIEEITEPSPIRVEPDCPLFGRCGGCQLQHLSYDGQLVVKKLIVNDALQRIGRVFLPVRNVSSPSDQWHYRNKTQYPVRTGPGFRIGFYCRGTHNLLDVPECLVHPQSFDRLRTVALEAAAGEQAYDEARHSGNIRHLILRSQHPDPGILAIVVTREDRLAGRFVEALAGQPEVVGVVHSVNPRRTNCILGPTCRSVTGQDHTVMTVLDKRFRVSPGSFFQVNTQQASRLCLKVLKYAAPEGNETVLDLFCGVGMLSLTLAEFAARVIGIELDPVAVADARHNAEQSRAGNTRFLAGDAARAIAGISGADIVVLDPPRKGCEPGLLKSAASLKPSRVIYVSCNPATLARDLKLLAELGYETRDVEPVDMFPQTCHVETVALLTPAGT